MCIRDSNGATQRVDLFGIETQFVDHRQRLRGEGFVELDPCLLYTSDAADERSSVDLGGRRIIKKKK